MTEKDSPSPGVAYGRLLESAHFSSYGFERLCDGLEWLLKDDRWRQLGDWDINEFLATIDLSSLNLGSKRPKLIKRIKELQPDASQRAIAKAVGVGQKTVSRDLLESNDSGSAAKLLKGNGKRSESESFDSWLAKPASETADKIRAAAQLAERRQAKSREDPDLIVTPGFPDGPFRTIVIDPPWPIEKIGFDRRPVEKLSMDYATMSLEDIALLPIPRLANQEGTHVYLWVTHRFLPHGLKLFDAWGVRYECVLTWLKPTAQPLWWRFLTEHILFGKIGALPPVKKGEAVSFNAPQQRHSHKPDQFFDLVSRVSPEPRLTMFDGPRNGFGSWGAAHERPH
jgi:N6-adenosine-specific RNA methylase IME4